MVAGFKKFIMGGNVIDLAVGVVVGAAFGALVTSFGDSFLTPLIAIITGGETGGYFTVSGQRFTYGAFISAIITFLITMAVIYFFVVTPINKIKEKRATEAEPEDPTNEEKMVALLERIANK